MHGECFDGGDSRARMEPERKGDCNERTTTTRRKRGKPKRWKSHLLLGVGSLLLLLLDAGLDLAGGAVGTTGLAEGLESAELLLLGGDGTGLLVLDTLREGENSLDGADSLDVGEVDLVVLVLLGQLGHNNQTGLVSLDALNIELEALLGLVAATVVEGDTDGARVLLAETGSLDLLNGETTSGADLGVVSQGGASDSGAEGLDGAQAKLGSLGLTRSASPLLGTGLVEPDLDPTLPVLAKVVVVKDVVVLHGHLL